ncbi:hypothetical protein ACFYY8_16860 [Streptosporangium sp. NPDC001559]|uniref:hypothetical protein n=1 Tax=Streptosporangium sp. NPDC001559 TaxID=3366187 RepID=UPI0036E27F1D
MNRLREVGRRLAEHGTRRDTVEIGVVLLGACGDERDREPPLPPQAERLSRLADLADITGSVTGTGRTGLWKPS